MGRLVPAGTGFVGDGLDKVEFDVEGKEKKAEATVVVPSAHNTVSTSPETESRQSL